MIELRTLGTIDLRGSGGPESTVLLRQPKRVALLAYPCLARPRGLHHRDTVVALFWPELDSEHARGALSQALHVLRRTLGSDVVVTCGPELVGVDPQRLWCDACVFEAALRDGRAHETLELYGGELLCGVAVAGTPAFDRWLDDERARLARLYEESLERLARQAEARGDPVAAVDRWRRLLTHDPYNTRAVLALMRVLDASGERPEAILCAQAHIRRVREDLEVEPDPEVGRLVDALRSKRAPTAETPEGGRSDLKRATPATTADSSAANAAPGPMRRRRIRAVAALAATGLLATGAIWSIRQQDSTPAADTATVRLAVLPLLPAGTSADDTVLADGLAEDVLTTLAHVPGLQVIAKGSSFRLRGEPDLREVGRRLGSDVVLHGAVERCDGRVCVATRLTDAGTGQVRWSQRYHRAAGDVGGLREDVSLAVAEELRVRLAPFRPNRYTTNARAYDRFLQGVYAHQKLTPEDLWRALQFYREAYEEDPSFALAHAIAAMAYMHLAGYAAPEEVASEEARKHATLALELDTLLAEGHAALGTLALHYDWDFGTAERSLRRARMIYPSLPQAHSQYGWYLLQVRGQPEEAVASIRHAFELDPLNAGRSLSVETALYLARRYDETLEQHRTTFALNPALPPDADEWPVAGSYREKGMYGEAIAEYVRVQERNGGVPLAGLAVTYARMGRTSDAWRLLRELEEHSRGGGHIPPLAIARIHAALGDGEGAFTWLERAYQARSNGMLTLGVEPTFDALRGDPRFADLLQRIGLSPSLAEIPSPRNAAR